MNEFYYHTPEQNIRAFKVLYEPYSHTVIFEFSAGRGLKYAIQAEVLLDDIIMALINQPDLKQVRPFTYQAEGPAGRLFMVFCEPDPDSPEGLPKVYLQFTNHRRGERAREEKVPLEGLLAHVLGRCRDFDRRFLAENPALLRGSRNLLEESTIVYGLEPDAAGCGT